ncbi:MAG: NAD(P)/FAD-dependent oxidoreductase [Oleiphilaceae bacterium]|nr:NAD(P)/FAD-dependent oxidoreductase [Oleiphilaceae bacterium]
MELVHAQTLVIGAGVVGLAVARALACSGREVMLLEANDHIGEETSSRNSEVIHAGLYYSPGSLKARLCREGRDALYRYCENRPIGVHQCGKWLVATEAEQLTALERLQANAENNGVTLTPVPDSALKAQPELRAVAALESPLTGIIDSHALMQSLLADFTAAGGWLVCRVPVLEARTDEQGHRLRVGGASPCEIRAREVVNAAGLSALPLARRWQGQNPQDLPRGHYAKGHYFAYNGRHPFSRLIYPLPDGAGLGIHLTLDLAGQARFGPDLQWLDTPDYQVPESLRAHFASAIQRWWPGLDPQRLVPSYAGVRPKLHGPGEAPADFMIQGPQQHRLPGLVQLFGIESPGLTACLPLAHHVLNLLNQSVGSDQAK